MAHGLSMARGFWRLVQIAVTFGGAIAAVAADESVSFQRQIQPILAEHCYACHGPDASHREAELRLDTAGGLRAVVEPGNSHASELFQRVTTSDPDQRMPPGDALSSLTNEQLQLLRRWIDQGAAWDEHWSFLGISRPQLPDRGYVSQPRRNSVDAFVQANLWNRDRRVASREATRHELIRRVTLDLTGLPPDPSQVDAFVNDPAPDAYERLVDRLLASPAFGERMAWDWLDAARYSDSNGYQDDADRTMWPWRDWVVQSLNRNLAYDQFTRWQIAGDLLPDRTLEQQLATGFCRNHMINGEGGRIPEENRVEYIMDITETVGTVWLGLTLNCCRCHDHKFDPLTQADYYQLFAFFNQTPIDGSGRDPQTAPVVEVVDADLAHEIELAQAELSAYGDSSDAMAATIKGQRDALVQRIEQLRRRIPRVMVMADDRTRATHVLQRGQYNLPGTPVSAGVPARLHRLPAGSAGNRLALAHWITDPANPLTARVVANRVWQSLFGIGLVKTAEDFGVQGERPMHGMLLDWLAREFVDQQWDMKHLVRLIVTSHTYRQSSRASDSLAYVDDPENRWLARGPRHRLPAWMLRDQALAASGLLVHRTGGPPVRGYQPAGVWEEATFGTRTYEQDQGAALYRRSLYTFWRRIVAPTMFFDNASRQVCTVRIVRTNTPLHALLTLNDVTYVEAARELAASVLTSPASGDRKRMDGVYRRICARDATDREAEVLQRGLLRTRRHYAEDPRAAEQLVGFGESSPSYGDNLVELASWTNLCLTVLNSDEALTKE